MPPPLERLHVDDNVVAFGGDFLLVALEGDVFVRQHAVGSDADEQENDGRRDRPRDL